MGGGPVSLLVAVTLASLLGLGAIWLSERPAPGLSGALADATAPGARLVSVSWVDGDSGTLDGREFRLHGVDAPEGSPSKARCRQEREKADVSRAAVRAMTRGRRVTVMRSHGHDRYGRELVELTVDGRDVARALIAAGHVKRWNFEGGQRKPEWCG